MSDTRDIEQLYCERCKRVHAFGYERTMGTMVQLASCKPVRQEAAFMGTPIVLDESLGPNEIELRPFPRSGLEN